MVDTATSDTGDDHRINRAGFDELTTADLHDILQLRSQIFVVEQDCVYLDIDGRDRGPATQHLWIRDRNGVAAAVRILDEGEDVWSIGRVVTRPDARSSGIGSRLMEHAIALLDEWGCSSIVLGAQVQLTDWYGRFGFDVAGDRYVEDGIAHIPMRRRRP